MRATKPVTLRNPQNAKYTDADADTANTKDRDTDADTDKHRYILLGRDLVM